MMNSPEDEEECGFIIYEKGGHFFILNFDLDRSADAMAAARDWRKNEELPEFERSDERNFIAAICKLLNEG